MEWVVYSLTSYAVVPACTWAGATVGIAAGKKIAYNIYRKSINKITGYVNYDLSTTRCYVINKGKLIEVDPRKKYIIENGAVYLMSDAESEWELIGDD